MTFAAVSQHLRVLEDAGLVAPGDDLDRTHGKRR